MPYLFLLNIFSVNQQPMIRLLLFQFTLITIFLLFFVLAALNLVCVPPANTPCLSILVCLEFGCHILW